MSLATKIFKKTISTKNSKLGIFVNLLFDRESYGARMLVFPNLKDFKTKSSLTSFFSSMGSTALNTYMYDLQQIVGQQVTTVATDSLFKGVSKVEQGRYEEIQKLSSLFYLIPVSEIDKIDGLEIKLVNSTEEYNSYLGMKGFETDLAFFNDEMFKDPNIYIPISLGLLPIRGLNLKDVENNKGRIIDAAFNIDKGRITHLICQTIEKGAIPRYVDITKIDFSTMTIPNKFEECRVTI